MSGLDQNLQRIGFGGGAECLVGVQDLVELKAMGDKLFGIDAVRLHCLQQHRRGDSVDQPRGNRDIAVPQLFQMQIRLDPVHAYVGDDTARRHDLLACDEAGWHADRFRPAR
jgi:hypothetical protein